MKKKALVVALCFLILGVGSYAGLKIKKNYEIKQNTSIKILNKSVKIGQFRFEILKVCKVYDKYKIVYKQNFLSHNYQLNFFFKDNLDRIYPVKRGKNSKGSGTIVAINKLPKDAKKVYISFVISENDYSKDKLYKVKLIGKKIMVLPA